MAKKVKEKRSAKRRQQYTSEERNRAERYSVAEGLSLETIKEKLDIPISTLKSWSSTYEWTRKRAEYQQTNLQMEEVLKRKELDLLVELDSPGANAATVDMLVKIKKLQVQSSPQKMFLRIMNGLITELLNDGKQKIASAIEPYMVKLADKVIDQDG